MHKIRNALNMTFLTGAIVLLSACSDAQERAITGEPTVSSTLTANPFAESVYTLVPTSTEIPPEQITPVTAISVEAATATPTSKNTPTSLSIVPTSSSLLEGPLIVFLIQNGERYLLFLDIATLTFRKVNQGPLVINALQWLDNGCHVFTGPNVIDLQGNILEKIDDPENEERFQVVVLSPDKQRGARDMFLGSHANVELDYLTLEILERTLLTTPVELAPNGGAYAYAWSPDGNWLAFSDFDENDILQVYRATVDGQVVEQLTTHLQDPGVIQIIEWSPNGQYIAYAAQAFLPTQYAHGGWIGLITLSDLQMVAINPDYFQYTRGLWWSEDNDLIAFVGEGFPEAPNALDGTQIHWADRNSGAILNSFYSEEVPGHFLSTVMPVGNLDTIFFGAKDGYYLLDATTNTFEKILDDIPTDGLIRDFVTSPFDFPGEENCLSVK